MESHSLSSGRWFDHGRSQECRSLSPASCVRLTITNFTLHTSFYVAPRFTWNVNSTTEPSNNVDVSTIVISLRKTCTLVFCEPTITPARAVKFLLNKQIAKVILRMSIGNWCCGDRTCYSEGKRQTLTATKQHTCLQPDPGCITKLHSIPPSTLLHGSRGM